MGKKSFNLRLWFAICSFGVIAAVASGSAWWLTNYMTSSLLQREGKLAQEFLESIVNVNGAVTFEDRKANEPANPMLLDLAQHLLGMPGISRINIYSLPRRVIWSSEPQLVGTIGERNGELEEAFEGQVVTELSDLGHEKGEHVALGKSGFMIEAYIPIRSNAGKGPILGVIEFYRLPVELDVMLRNGRLVVWLGAATAALLLFLALYGIVQRGAMVIERQQDSLSRMETLAAIGQMASAVAHSLRNPMSSIRSTAELWGDQLPPETRFVATETIAEVDRMDRYVKDLLAYAQSERSQLAPVDTVGVVDAIIETNQRAAERAGVTIRRTGGGEALVLANERLLEQSLTSLVTNAIEAMPAGGTLEIVVAPKRRGRVKLTFVDTGRGIPPDLLKRVADSYFTTKSRGLGLGLVLARSIIEKFGGRMEIASVVGAGTRVTVDLRAA